MEPLPEKPRILIVDDAPGNIKLLKEILGKSYQTSAATNGPDALLAVAAKPPNLILLDVVMPGMDGHEVCRRLKADDATRDIPIIFVTVQNAPSDEVLGLTLGAVDFISKPLNPPVVRARIKTHLEKKKALADNVAKNAFLATMSHEIRTPLNVMLGIGELLMESTLSDEQRQLLTTFNHAGESLLVLVNDILDFSKIEAGQLDLQSVPINLPQLVCQTVEIFFTSARNKGVRLECAIGDGVPDHVVGDPGRLRQILVNLLSNAVKFTQHGEVKVHVYLEKSDWVTLQVSDTGIGIPENQLATIFHPFHQANPTIARQFGGTGLGLAICDQLVSKLGGTLKLDSVVQQGSVFTVQLPMPSVQVEPSVAPIPQMQFDKPPLVEKVPLAILLAEDSEDNVLLIMAFLKREPYTITVVEDGRSAVERFCRERFDLVLMDIQMPILDGISATKEIRAYEREQQRPRTPVVVLTAHALQEMLETAWDAGCDYYLTKPIKKGVLLEALDRVATRTPFPVQHRPSNSA